MRITIITNNSEKWIAKVIKRLAPYLIDNNILFIDNHSTDNTVPNIINLIGINFENEDKYKFYINTNVKTEEECLEMVDKIVKDEKYVIINKNMNIKQLEKLLGGK